MMHIQTRAWPASTLYPFLVKQPRWSGTARSSSSRAVGSNESQQ